MLTQIICDKFKVQPLKFKEGLNCVLGDDCATNSIGKSSFLMIIDFVFGGDDYLNLNHDIIDKVGDHEFKFSFDFNGELLYFIRSTRDKDHLKVCDKNYSVLDTIELKEYFCILKEKYNMPDDISIRNSLGRYARVYPKENLSIKKPLSIVLKETDEKAVLSLLKLFDSYKVISELLKELSQLDEECDSIKLAQKYNLVPNITATRYKSNAVLISELLDKIKIAKATILNKSINIEALLTTELMDLRRQKTQLISRITFLKSKLERIIQDNLKAKSSDIISYEEIVQFFPDVDIEKIKELDNFHFSIQEIISQEVKVFKKELEEEIAFLTNKLKDINERSKTLYNTDNETQKALETFNKLTEMLNKINAENAFYEKKLDAKQKYDDKHKLYALKQKEQLDKAQQDINSSLQKLNDYIYNGERIAPSLSINEKKYDYVIDNDHGTGIAYKNLIILDLSILNLTTLPCLIHDSVLLKQIEDDAMEKITELYDQSRKQIFIAFDKLSSYTKKTQELMNSSCILRLSKEDPLFGFVWSKDK